MTICFIVSVLRVSISLVFSLSFHSWYSGSTLDCWATGWAIDLAPGTRFITKFISLARCPRPSIALQVQNRCLKYHSFLDVFLSVDILHKKHWMWASIFKCRHQCLLHMQQYTASVLSLTQGFEASHNYLTSISHRFAECIQFQVLPSVTIVVWNGILTNFLIISLASFISFQRIATITGRWLMLCKIEI